MTRTRSGKIADIKPQASRRNLTAKKAAQFINKPSPTTEHAEDSTNTAAIADASTKDHAANNPVSSASKDTAPSDPTPINSTSAIADAAENTTENHASNNPVTSATQDPAPNDPEPTTSTEAALPIVSAQPVNLTTNDVTPTTSAIADAPFTSDTTEENTVNNPVTSATKYPAPNDPEPTTSDAASTCEDNEITEQDAPPMTSTKPVSPRNRAGSQSSASGRSDKDQTLVRRASSQPLNTGKIKRKSERRARKRGAKPLITVPGSPDNPITVDDGSDDGESDGSVDDSPDVSVDYGSKSVNDRTDDGQSDDVPIARSIKQILRYRQRHVEKMKSSLDNLIAYIGSTADSDQSSNYNGMRVGAKRSFEDFIAAELDDSDQRKAFASDILDEILEYQGMLQRTKRLQRQ